MVDCSAMDWNTIGTAAATAVVSSAVATALLNIVFIRYTERVKSFFTASVEALKADHAAQLAVDQARRSSQAARTEAHYAAVLEHAGRVATVYEDLDAIASSVLGDEAGYFDIEARALGSERDVAARVAANLREVWTRHPTQEVRRAAHRLYDEVKGFYGDPPLSGRDWPSPQDDDTLLAHRAEAESLIELLHTPPAQP